MHILFVSSEFHPHAKSGGLADAVASLSRALASRGHRITVVLPLYESVPRDSLSKLDISLGVPLGLREEWTAVHGSTLHGVELFFLEHRILLGRSGIYGPSPARAYEDNLRRFALLSRGALQLALALEWTPEVIHAHDWPSGLTPVYYRSRYAEGILARSGTVFSIHNFGYQGWYPEEQWQQPGLSPRELRETRTLAGRPGENEWGKPAGEEINLVKGALATADRIVAVSPRYAQEIQTPAFGYGLHEDAQARRDDLRGILNGIDEDEWDPQGDVHIPAHYSREDRAGKRVCKRTLQQEYGLPRNADTPLVGMVTRLTEQKGIGALFGPGHGSLYRICMELPIQFVFLGSGEVWCEEEIRKLHERIPNFSAIIGYDHGLAHRIKAGSDFFLMPSTYEPCGLNQMYAMRYGTIPIVTSTGGLADTVDDETGFFIREYSPQGIFEAVKRSVNTYLTNPRRIAQIQRNGMQRDFSWDRSAEEYEDLYRELFSIRRRNRDAR